jgi:predicted nucleic acid-binding protein
MSQHYLDTNPLIRWAESQAASAHQRSTTAGQRVEELIHGETVVAISEITLIEFHDVVCTYCRSNKPGDHDPAWLSGVQESLMTWIADGSLLVLPPFPRMYETAMSYITLVLSQGRRLKAWDAIHLCRATEWARETESRVTIVSGDADFETFLKLFPTLRGFIDLERIGTYVADDC